ncbi:MAG: 4-(cytidine 5'-diphospho)-2-C-methyl-D-erythritol kinase [Firmicutes bacterium]|nr:4-(cytidine 5'-diphospho)-2-C-methyl-D-erythritol kinase [Bacillota bacterium]
MSDRLKILAPAKINWSLEIVGQREDGYHLLRSIMQQIALYDEVEIKESSADHCFCSGLMDQENLAFRAWLHLKEQLCLKQCLEIRIEKKIPLGAGLAGGSTDAAAVLLGANRLLALGLPETELLSLALPLGADIPFCISGGACLVEGIGEKLTPLPEVQTSWLVLANPGFPVSTPMVYREYDRLGSSARPDLAGVRAALETNSSQRLTECWGNHLYDAACSLYPALNRMTEAFSALGLPALMSGSGGTFFAPCSGEKEAREAADRLRMFFPWAMAVSTLMTEKQM